MSHQKVTLVDDGIYNIIRTQGALKSIFQRNVKGKDARIVLSNLKRRARDNRSNVFFDAQLVPSEVLQNVA